jgi:signal transduction histidine kinase/CheY-like chemotaxis protein
MNDMSVLEHYKDRPYIAGWPYMKYYAEVPIHTPSGLTIGTLCVVDNKAKDGLDLKGLSILREISEAIMNHLELCVSRIQRNNAERMIQALGKFVEGKESVREWWIEAQASRGAEPGLQHLSVEKRADIELGSAKEVVGMSDGAVLQSGPNRNPKVFETLKSQPESADYFDTALSSQCESSTPDARALSDEILDKSMKSISPSTTVTSPGPTRSLSEMLGGEMRRPSIGNQFPSGPLSDLEKMLCRATNLIREGIGLDGIVLFDPRSTDGQLLIDFNMSGEKVAWSDRRSSISATTTAEHFNNPSSYFSPYSNQTSHAYKYCKVLASSTRKKSNSSGSRGEALEMPESVLRQLLQRFPAGGILNYDEKGFIGGSNSIFLRLSKSQKLSITSGSKPRTDEPSQRDDLRVANQLRLVLPEVTSVLLLPLWDTNHDKWFAYSMAWTTNPARIFEQQDFTYLASFGNSVITELSRLETVAADQAKSGFISSISHELRSPLHGIMASVELLRDFNSDPVSNDIVSTIESCGSTLLDTIENLLTFSKVNRLSSRKASFLERQLVTVDLGSLVEDVTQMLIAGHQFRQTVEKFGGVHHRNLDSGKGDVNAPLGPTVICDISPACNWIFKSDVGVWKRILMNLLGNSLKYTYSGYILVRLRLEKDTSASNRTRHAASATQAQSMIDLEAPTVSSPVTEGPPIERQSNSVEPDTKACNVTLTIEDSGKGMSQDYLTHHLFKPFYQEDSLSPGTGLGLSIVHQLVSSIGGSIKVTSELGSGTEIRLDVALERPSPTTTLRTSPSTASRFRNLRLGLCGLDVVPDLAESPSGILDTVARRSFALRSTLAEYATSLGFSVATVNTLNSDAADITIITEAEYRRICSSHDTLVNRPLIVLAEEPTLHYKQFSPELSAAFILSQPYVLDTKSLFLFWDKCSRLPRRFGPRSFRKSLESCLSTVQPSTTLNQPLRILPRHKPVVAASSEERTASTIHMPETITGPLQESFSPSRQKHLSLLLVEDNPINLKLLVASFKKMGHPFETASDGAQAVSAYCKAEGKFDVVFMDIQMPVMNGMEATLEIRKYEKQNGLRSAIIIALTALTSVGAEQEAMDNGVDRFLSKPVSMRKLREVVGEYFKAAKEGG